MQLAKKVQLMFMTCILLAGTLIAQDEEEFCFTYTLIANTQRDGFNSIRRAGTGYSINSLGQVGFTANVDGTFAGQGIFVGNGGVPTELYRPPNDDFTETAPQVIGDKGVSINDHGSVAFNGSNAIDSINSVADIYITDGTSVIPLKLRPNSTSNDSVFCSFTFSGDSFNNSGRVACAGEEVFGDHSFDPALVTLDGTTTQILFQDPTYNWSSTTQGGLSKVAFNDLGQAAVLRGIQNTPFPDCDVNLGCLEVWRGGPEPGLVPERQRVGNLSEIQVPYRFFDASLNNLGNLAFTIREHDGFGNTLDERVLLAGDTGLSTVVTAGDGFRDLRGVSTNDLNTVAFHSARFENALPGLSLQGVFVGFPNDDQSPMPVVVDTLVIPLDFGDGIQDFQIRALLRHGTLQSRALNDSGQVVFFAETWHPDNSFAGDSLIRAEPNPGCLPGNPVMPSNDFSQDGFFRFPMGIGSTRLRFVDPPVVTGYLYSSEGPNFESVRIPAPLPEGDATFEVQFAEMTLELTASTTFNFTDYVPEGVAEFVITGIDEAEMLPPDDPTAFVTGVSFVSVGTTKFDVIMTPLTSDEPTEEVPPTLTCAADVEVENDPGLCSASTSFEVTATGVPDPTVECTLNSAPISSPHTFDVGSNSVTCTATNGVSPDAICGFTVMVADVEAPTINCPADLEVAPTSLDGTVIEYTSPTASDNCSSVALTASPASGSRFPIGSTVVTAMATDLAGNSSDCSFSVTVLTFQEVLQRLITQVQALVPTELSQDQAAGLIDKLQAAITSINAGEIGDACNQLRAFQNQVRGLVKAGQLSEANGQALQDVASELRNALGC